jgi:hypothetical protein
MQNDREELLRKAHAYLDRLSEEQVSAVRRLLETMVDPAIRKRVSAPVEDEEISEEEERAFARSREWFKNNPGIPFEQVVAETGVTMAQVRNNRLNEEKDPET